MNDTKIVKAYCGKHKRYYGLEVKQFGSVWKVVNMVSLQQNEFNVIMSQVVQPTFDTNENLKPCLSCGNRRIGGCGCSQTRHACNKNMPYKFDCVYCNEFKVDYSFPTGSARDFNDSVLTLGQCKEVKLIDFSNVQWNLFDNVPFHEDGSVCYPHEPRIHVKAAGKDIEFHGYNISKMDEGVYYDIPGNDDFGIECDVNTTTIQEHPGGYFYVNFGAITAQINQHGGSFMLNGSTVATVGSRFKMQLLLTEGGHYSVFIDGVFRGDVRVQNSGKVRIIFGFTHESHHCHLLSHADLSNIRMIQTKNR